MHASKRELMLTLVALAAVGVAPNVAVVAFAGVASLRSLFWGVVIPAEVVVLGVAVYARLAGMRRLLNRIVIGVAAGVALTIALDVVRYPGFRIGFLPGDMPLVFGNHILGRAMDAAGTPLAYLMGYGYHVMNGIAFGTVYSVLFGKTRWWVAVLYSVFFVEAGMMLLPPMAKMVGPFGVDRHGTILNPFFLTTLLAHVSMGIVLGLVVKRWGKYRGLVFAEGRRAEPVAAAAPRRPPRARAAESWLVIALSLCCGATVLLLALGGAGLIGAGAVRASVVAIVVGAMLLAMALAWWARPWRRAS